MNIEWNGVGLPPVGCECELYDCEQWNPVRIKYVGEKYVVTDRTDLGYEVVYCLAEKPERFRPLRTEAERKIDEAAVALTFALTSLPRDQHVTEWAYAIVEKIEAGAIPHITLK